MSLLHPRPLTALLYVSTLLTVMATSGRGTDSKLLFRQDLKQFGFPVNKNGLVIANYTDLNFLSNELILVSVNSRVFGPAEKSNSDEPSSQLLLFDLSKNALAKKSEIAVEKDANSVKATHDGNFVLLNETGIHLCSRDLQCGLSIPSTGPVLVSPQGTRLVVGGNGQTNQRLLDADNLRQLDQFAWGQQQVVPGDHDRLLIRRKGKLYVRLPDLPERLLPLAGIGIWPEARFLNDTNVADFESDSTFAVARTDGNILFRKPVKARWHVSEVVTSASGSRFCFHEAGYTRLNSMVNFLDVDSGRPFNFETVEVASTDSGLPLLELHWDPRPYVGRLSSPALSPDGDKVAVIQHGFLEVYQVP